MGTNLLRKTALTAAGIAVTAGGIAGPITAAYAADAKPHRPDRPQASGERELGRPLRGPAQLLLLRPRRRP